MQSTAANFIIALGHLTFAAEFTGEVSGQDSLLIIGTVDSPLASILTSTNLICNGFLLGRVGVSFRIFNFSNFNCYHYFLFIMGNQQRMEGGKEGRGE
jgi:hypothetical protein